MQSFLDSLTGRLGGGRQLAIIAIGVVVTAVVFGVSRWATAPTMVPLYADLPVENVKAMTDQLTESGITYTLDRTGTTILVASEDLARARVDLAAGDVPNAGRPGLELFDKPTWGMTDFTQKVNYRRALEGELERTISKMKNVEAVKVHLALEDERIFKPSERPSKASVTLTMYDGNPPAPGTVQGVAQLVASSVGGLEPEHVTIVDARGHALTMQDEGSLAGLSSRQLLVQKEVESYLEEKASRLRSSLVGSDNVRVQVAASINFSKVERTVQAVDPERQALTTEQKAEVTPSTPQQGAGYSTSATSYENTKSVETFSGAIGNVTKLTVAVLVADKVARPAPDTTATAPAQASATPRTAEELTRIEALVRNALGVDSTRGDMISVVSAPFDIAQPEVTASDSIASPTDIIARIQENSKPIVAIAALLVLLIVVLFSVFVLRPRKTQSPLPAAPESGALQTSGYAELPASTQMPLGMQGAPADQGNGVEATEGLESRRTPIKLPPMSTTPEREQAIATVEQRPDAALRVTRHWLRQ